MIDLSLTAHDLKRIQTLLDGFGQEVSRAYARSINRVARGVKTDSIRAARLVYNVKAKDLRGSMRATWASVHRINATVKSVGGRRLLGEYGMRTSSGRRKRGISVLVKKTTGRVPLRHAFFANEKNGKPQIVEREGEARLPLKTLYGPSIAQMLGNPAVVRAIERGAPERFHRNFNHEIERILLGKNRR